MNRRTNMKDVDEDFKDGPPCLADISKTNDDS